MSCISEVLYADIYFLHQTITFVASFLSGNCHGRRYLLVWYAGGERTPRRDLCVRSHVGHQLLPKIDDAVCNDSVWNGLLQRLCEKISVNSTTVIKKDIVERLEKQPLNFFTVYNKYRNLSSFFNSQSAEMERSGMEAD